MIDQHRTPVAQAIRDHQIHDSGSWEHKELVTQFYQWADRINEDFRLHVPSPVIAIASLRPNVLGLYRLGHDEIGSRTRITLNAMWLAPRLPMSRNIQTLLHEMVHAWEEWYCGRERGGWYHTIAWREKMAKAGIVADEHGQTLRIDPKFIAYLDRHGLPTLHRSDRDWVLPGNAAGAAASTNKTRLHPLKCPNCGYAVWTTLKWITKYSGQLPSCPCGHELSTQ